MPAGAGPERHQARCGPWALVEWPVLIGCNAASASVMTHFGSSAHQCGLPTPQTGLIVVASRVVAAHQCGLPTPETHEAAFALPRRFAISSRTERPARTAPDGRSHQGHSECRLREQVGNVPNVGTGRWTCCNRTRVPRPVTKRSPSTKRPQPRRPKQA
jgi:hypothetical protein